jgi:hypothetical protein
MMPLFYYLLAMGANPRFQLPGPGRFYPQVLSLCLTLGCISFGSGSFLCAAPPPVTTAPAPAPPVESPSVPRLAAPQIVNWSIFTLDTDQKAAIEKYDIVWKRAFEQLYPTLLKERQRLRILLFSKDTQPDDVVNALKQVESTEGELRFEAVKNFLQKKQLLNAEQKSRLQEQLSNTP